MYLVGAPHPHKADAQRVLEKLVGDRQRLVTDAEVLCKRYCTATSLSIVGTPSNLRSTPCSVLPNQVLAVDLATAERAKEIVMGHRKMSARDAVHLAVMEHHGIERILSFDSGFDGFPGITRLS